MTQPLYSDGTPIPDEKLAEAQAKGEVYFESPEAPVDIVDEYGLQKRIPASELGLQMERGASIRTQSDVQRQLDEEQYGTIGEQGKTFAEGLVRGVPFVGGPAYAGLVEGGVIDREASEKRAEVNPGALLSGEILSPLPGAAALKLVDKVGDASKLLKASKALALPEKALAKASEVAGRVASRVTKNKALKSIAGGIAEGGVQGGVFAANQAIADAAMRDDPLTAEMMLDYLGPGVVFGGAFGGALGGADALLRRGSDKIKRLVDDTVTDGGKATRKEFWERIAAEEATQAVDPSKRAARELVNRKDAVDVGKRLRKMGIVGEERSSLAGAVVGKQRSREKMAEVAKRAKGENGKAIGKMIDDADLGSRVNKADELLIELEGVAERMRGSMTGTLQDVAPRLEKQLSGLRERVFTYQTRDPITGRVNATPDKVKRMLSEGATQAPSKLQNDVMVVNNLSHRDLHTMQKELRTGINFSKAQQDLKPFQDGLDEMQKLTRDYLKLSGASVADAQVAKAVAGLDAGKLRRVAKDVLGDSAAEMQEQAVRRELLDKFASGKASGKEHLGVESGTEFGRRWSERNADYGAAAWAEKQLSDNLARGQSNRFFGLTDNLQAVTGAALGASLDSFTGGALGSLALMAGNKYLRTHGRTITSDLAAYIAKGERQIDKAAKSLVTSKTGTGRIAQTSQKVIGKGVNGKDTDKLSSDELDREYWKAVKKVREAQESPRDVIQLAASRLGPNLSQNPHVMSVIARRLGHVNAKIPAAKSTAGQSLTPHLEKPRVSDVDKRKWLSTFKATFNPSGVLESIESGSINRDEIEALKTANPAMFKDLQTRVFRYLSESEDAIPYTRTIMLGNIFDIPGHRTQSPEMVTSIQTTVAELAGEQAAEEANARLAIDGLKDAEKLGKNTMTVTQKLAVGG